VEKKCKQIEERGKAMKHTCPNVIPTSSAPPGPSQIAAQHGPTPTSNPKNPPHQTHQKPRKPPPPPPKKSKQSGPVLISQRQEHGKRLRRFRLRSGKAGATKLHRTKKKKRFPAQSLKTYGKRHRTVYIIAGYLTLIETTSDMSVGVHKALGVTGRRMWGGDDNPPVLGLSVRVETKLKGEKPAPPRRRGR